MIGAVLTALEGALWWLLSCGWSALLWCLSPVNLALAAVAGVLIYRYCTRDSDFWPSQGVRCPPVQFLRGHSLGSNMLDIDQRLYDEYHGEEGFAGYMELIKPVLHVSNPDLIRSIFIQDFDHFTDRRDMALTEELKATLLLMNGPKWKEARAALTPTFSGSKLRAMHQLCLDNAVKLADFMRHQTDVHGGTNIPDAMGRFTMDNIASCAFGFSCNSFTDPNTEFARNASVLFTPPKGFGVLRIVLLVMFPKLNWILYRLLPDPYKPPLEFFKRVIKKTIAHREQSGIVRRDILQLLLETRDKNGERIFTDHSIVMNSVLFLQAGYDTTAGLLQFCAYSLATSPDIQERLQRHLDEVLERHGGQLTYDAVAEMTYLDQVLAETLRLYPIGFRLERQCSIDYTLPGTDVKIPRGMLVQVPVLAIHRDARHYPEPLRFDPDRFLPEEKQRRHPCAYLPFGAGPRSCIAMRFALFEAKVAMAELLKSYRLEPTDSTPPPPVPIDKTQFLLRPEKTIVLKVVPRT